MEPTEDKCYNSEDCEVGDESCGNGEGCEDGQFCWSYENPNGGVTSFDNIMVTFLTIFTCITLEGWTDTMYTGRDVSGNKYSNDPYFIALVVIGAYLVINLVIAVLYINFH